MDKGKPLHRQCTIQNLTSCISLQRKLDLNYIPISYCLSVEKPYSPMMVRKNHHFRAAAYLIMQMQSS